MNTEKNCQSCKYYKDGYCEDLELKPYYPQKGCDDFSKRNEDIINEAYLRANSIDAVRGFAYKNGHIRECEELDRARTIILKLIDYIEERRILNEIHSNLRMGAN